MANVTQKPGTISWMDLTVPDAAKVRDFYQAVVGWKASPVDMGGYSDFNMLPPGADQPAAGICHARGPNADLPPVWLIYINVADLDASIAQCKKLGGQILAGPKDIGAMGRYCVIQDPAGAIAALFQPA